MRTFSDYKDSKVLSYQTPQENFNKEKNGTKTSNGREGAMESREVSKICGNTKLWLLINITVFNTKR